MAKAPSSLSRLVAYARPEQPLYRDATLYSILNKLFDIAPEILIGVAVDVVVRREHSFMADLGLVSPGSQLVALGVLTALIWAGESWFQYLYQLKWRTLAQLIQARVRSEVYDHVQHLPTSEWNQRRSGELQTLLTEDVNQLERFLNGGVNDMIQVVTSTLAVMAVFFFLAPNVALLAMIPIPVIVVIAFVFQRGLGVRYAEVREQGGRLGARLTGQLRGLATLRAFNAEARALQALEADSQAYLEANAQAIRWSSAFVPLVRMAILVGFLVTLVLGGLQTLAGGLGVGAFSVLVFLTQRLLWPFTRLGETVDLYQRSMASAGRLFDLLAVPTEPTEGKPPRGEGAPSLRFEGVRFRYAGAGQEALRGVDFAIEPEAFVGLVGSTGSGKSTIVRLLLRMHRPTEGRIMFHGEDLQTLSPAELRARIGWVEQDVFVFHGTVRDNIALGKPDASDAEIRAAAEIAELHETIEGWPQRYETVVGEFGATLSGGERQRLAIARALVRDPPLLIFDEATSAVDNETEQAIHRSIQRAARGRTVVAIAHRLSTVREANQILVLERGEVVERGTHATLLDDAGVYAALVAAGR